METSDQKHILVLITNPFAVLNTIHSGLMGHLGKCYQISIMSDLLTAADVELFNKHFQLNMQLLKTPVPTISRFEKWLRAVQTALFGYYFGLETTRIKVMERGKIFYRIFSLCQKIPTLTILGASVMGLIRNWLIRRTALPDLDPLSARNFQAVVSTSPFDLRENAITNSLQIHGTSIISIIISWDNLTSKGLMNARPDLVLVWNTFMALEYQRYYAMFGELAAVRIAGIPRFDIYFRNPDGQSSNPAGIPGTDTNTRIILFPTGAVKHHSCQNYIIEDLLEYARSRPDIVILVRCHPRDDPRRYEHLSSVKNLRFSQPFGENTNRVPQVDFLEMLHIQLTTCAVCVQVASTMFLDAAACNKPCISIAYDAHSGVDYAGSVKRFYDYSHQLVLHKVQKKHIVYDRRELFRKLDEILDARDVSTDHRKAVKCFTGENAADSAWLSAQYIREWLG